MLLIFELILMKHKQIESLGKVDRWFLQHACPIWCKFKIGDKNLTLLQGHFDLLSIQLLDNSRK